MPWSSGFSQRPQHEDLPVLRSKHDCDRGSHESRPGIRERSACLAALPTTPRTASTGRLLGHSDLPKEPPFELVLTSLYYLLNVQVRDHSFLMLFYHLPLLPLVGPRVDQPTLREKDLPRAESQRSLAMCLLNPVLSSNSPPTNRCTESAAESKTERKCKNPQGLL